MSLVHMRLKLALSDSNVAEYDVESIDFNDEMNWEKICVIRINKNRKDYEFEFHDKLKNDNILPPTIYGLSEDERALLLKTRYKDFGYGAWSMRIHHWVNNLIQQNHYPAKYP